MTETLLVSDYSGLEMAISGDLYKRLFDDDQVIRMYDDQLKGADMHSNNAREVFGKWLRWTVPAGMPYAGKLANAIPVDELKKHPFGKVLRDMIKAIFYGLSYGAGAYKFGTMTGADGKEIGEKVAGQMIDALLSAVPGMRKWFVWVEEYVRKHHGVYSLGGRWCDLANEMESDNEWDHKRAFRRAYNFPCQATAAEIIGSAMLNVNACDELRDLGYRTMLQVHDELILRGPLENVKRAGELLTGCMKAATANGTRLLVNLQTSLGHGDNYSEAK
jgi:DNA polymerase I-like protein with 3'-5' exonuclease and polymerase domains